MRYPPQLLWKRKLLISFFLILPLLLISLNFQKEKSSLGIDASANKFRVNFDITKNDQEAFLKFLEKLNIPRNITGGFEFELDNLSSAKFAFISPISANLEIKEDKINFEGSTSYPPFNHDLIVESLKIPKETSLVVFAPDVSNFAKSRLTLTTEISSWIDTQLSLNSGQYLLILGRNSDIVIIFKNPQVSFEPLKNLSLPESDEPLYKEEIQEGITFHLLKIPAESSQRPQTLAFSQIGQWNFLATSLEAIQKVVQAQKTPEHLTLQNQGRNKASVIIFYQNASPNHTPEFLFEVMFGAEKKVAEFLKNVELIEFSLIGKDFSGLIEVK